MKTNNKNIRFFFIALLILAIVAAPIIFTCRHSVASAFVVQESTCTELGQEDVICEKCNEVLESHTLPMHDHEFGEYKLIIKPMKDRNGLEKRYCVDCNKVETREYVCPHEDTYTSVVTESTCFEHGLEIVVCEYCETIVEERELELADHANIYTSVVEAPTCVKGGLEIVACADCNVTIEEHKLSTVGHFYGNWIYTKYATPVEGGERHQKCNVCGYTAYYEYTMNMAGTNSVYIPGTGINHNFYVGSFTQADVDAHDIVYCGSVYDGNPIILGHNTGSMRGLQYTKVGQKMYVSLNGRIEVYEVVISEFAMQNAEHNDIIGQSSGISLWDTVGAKTVRLYTCHGGTNGRWLVLAKLVETF